MEQQSKIIANNLVGTKRDEYGEKYKDHLVEQYKLFLTLTDKISDRRATANSFFLTLNSAIISAAAFSGIISKTDRFLVLIVGLSVITLCYLWYRIIRSYRDLNTAKFKVIHEIEKKLPLRPYNAEWEAVGRGENKKLYLPFSHIEIIVPWIFIFLYAVLIFYSFLVGNPIKEEPKQTSIVQHKSFARNESNDKTYTPSA